MQVPVVHVELGLEGLALLAIARLDGFLELKGRVCRRQHGRGVSTDHMQLRFGEAGDIKAMVDDRIMQRAVFAVGVAHIDGRQDHAACPRGGGLDQQHRRRAIAQQLPVRRGQQGFFQWVVGEVLFDHQATAFGLLHIDDGFMQAVVPGLLGGDAVAVFFQAFLEQAQQRRMLVLLVTDQQVQVRVGHFGNQLGTLEGQAFRMLGFDDHQDAADGLHGRDLQKGGRWITIVAGRQPSC